MSEVIAPSLAFWEEVLLFFVVCLSCRSWYRRFSWCWCSLSVSWRMSRKKEKERVVCSVQAYQRQQGEKKKKGGTNRQHKQQVTVAQTSDRFPLINLSLSLSWYLSLAFVARKPSHFNQEHTKTHRKTHRNMQQQTAPRPLIAEIEQLRRSVDVSFLPFFPSGCTQSQSNDDYLWIIPWHTAFLLSFSTLEHELSNCRDA